MTQKGAAMVTKGIQTKENIVDRSLHLFSVKGYYNTSVTDILDATGLTKGGLYGHFKSKEDIWHASYERAVGIWKEIVFQNLDHLDDPLERIEKALENDLKLYLGKDVFKGGCFFLNMLVELSGQSDKMSQCVLDGIMGFSNVISRWLKEADDKSMLKPGVNRDQVARFVVTSINGCAALYAATHSRETIDTTLAQIHQYLGEIRR